VLAGAGTLGVGATGAYLLTNCRSTIDDLDEGDVGSQVDIQGNLSVKSSDGSRIYVRGDEKSARVLMQARYSNQVKDMDTGSCVSVTGVVTEITDRDTVVIESGEL